MVQVRPGEQDNGTPGHQEPRLAADYSLEPLSSPVPGAHCKVPWAATISLPGHLQTCHLLSSPACCATLTDATGSVNGANVQQNVTRKTFLTGT